MNGVTAEWCRLEVQKICAPIAVFKQRGRSGISHISEVDFRKELRSQATID